MDYRQLTAETISAGGNQHVVIQDLTRQFAANQKIVKVVPSLDTFPTRGRVRTADVNIDGFPDLYLSLEFEIGNSKVTKSFVLLNEPCTNDEKDSTCSQIATEHSRYGLDLPRRFFKVDYKDGNFDSAKITELAGSDSVLLVPIDIDDDGRMDTLVQRCV